MAKMARERALQERREQKQRKKDERKQAAAAGRSAEADESTPSENAVDDETRGGEPLAGPFAPDFPASGNAGKAN